MIIITVVVITLLSWPTESGQIAWVGSHDKHWTVGNDKIQALMICKDRPGLQQETHSLGW